MPREQTFSNHVRWYPLVHFVIIPLLIVVLVWNIVLLYQQPNWDRAILVLFVLTVALLSLAARLQALKAQDRVIRLEEQLRFHNLLPGDLAQQCSNLRSGQIIAMRFAPDDELLEIARRVLNGELSTSKEIKSSVKNWRPDYHRV